MRCGRVGHAVAIQGREVGVAPAVLASVDSLYGVRNVGAHDSFVVAVAAPACGRLAALICQRFGLVCCDRGLLLTFFARPVLIQPVYILMIFRDSARVHAVRRFGSLTMQLHQV